MFKVKITSILIKFGLALIILGGIIFVLGIQINSLTKKLSQINNQAEVIRIKENSKQDLARDSDIAKNAMPILQKALPSSDNLIDFIADLENIAAVTGNKQELSFAGSDQTQSSANQALGEGANKTTKESLDFTITLEGTLASLQNYLSALEDLPYVIEIKKISSSGDDLSGSSKTNIQAVLYTSNK